MRVVTPLPIILSGLFTEMKQRYSGMTIQFDPSLSYEEAVRGVRTVRTSKEITEDALFPLFTFNREIIRPYEDHSRYNLPSHKIGNTPEAFSFKQRFVEISLPFKHYESDAIMFDTFEVMYINKASYNTVLEFTIELPVIGAFTYQVIWSNLDSLEYSIEDNRYISATGSLILRGSLIVMDEVPDPLIQFINLRIKDYQDTVLSLSSVSA